MSNKKLKNILILLCICIALLSVIISTAIYTIDELVSIIESLVEIDKAQTSEIEELWKNIDALSEDYTQLYQEIYNKGD